MFSLTISPSSSWTQTGPEFANFMAVSLGSELCSVPSSWVPITDSHLALRCQAEPGAQQRSRHHSQQWMISGTVPCPPWCVPIALLDWPLLICLLHKKSRDLTCLCRGCCGQSGIGLGEGGVLTPAGPPFWLGPPRPSLWVL